MRVSFESKGNFSGVTSWLQNIGRRNPSATLEKIASEGTASLMENTPKRTGATASGWVAEITTEKNVSEIAWINTAHPETEVSVAKLIELGHATRTHGYVPPEPYIKKSMDSVFNTVGDRISKELID